MLTITEKIIEVIEESLSGKDKVCLFLVLIVGFIITFQIRTDTYTFHCDAYVII